MDDEKDPHYCSFLITQAPSSSCLHGKTTLFTFLHFSAGGYAEQSDSVHLLLPKTSSKIHPGKGKRGEERRGRGTFCVKLLPCHALSSGTPPSPHRESFEAALLHLWSTDLTIKKIAENGLQTTTSSHCMHFQEVICDIQEAPSILVKMVIILKEGRGKGREIA